MDNKQLSFFEEKRAKRREIRVCLDRLYIFSVFFILIIIISFSLGVEKGKRINSTNIKTENSLNQEVAKEEGKKENINLVKPSTEEEEKKEAVKEEPKESNLEKLVFYSIQVASYTRKETAQIEANKLKNRGFGPVTIKEGKYIALCVGKFKTVQEAKTLVRSLKTYYNDCFVRKL